MKPYYTLYADFNNADIQGRVRLNTNGTFRDLEANNIELMPGLEVLLDNYDDLEATGIIEFSDMENIWVAKIDWESLRYK